MISFDKFLDNNKIEYLTNQPLNSYSTFKLGGVCPFIVFPKSENDLIMVLDKIKKHNLKFYTVGNGSNTLFKDKPSVDVVISLKNMPKELTAQNNMVYASSNINLFEFNKFLKDNEFAGFEFSFGIPGNIGGSIKGNAGAFDDCVCNHLKSVKVLDIESLKVVTLQIEQIKYSYRKTNIKGIILNALFEFKKGNFYEISKLQQKYYSHRKNTQPLEYNNIGSIFKRGKNCIPAKLIDDLGLKGFSIGGAIVSNKHAGFIIKKDNTCKSQDVIDLIKFIKKEVKKAYNINLKDEIVIV